MKNVFLLLLLLYSADAHSDRFEEVNKIKNNDIAQQLITICNDYGHIVKKAKDSRYTKDNPLKMNDQNTKDLNLLSKIVRTRYAQHDIDAILKIVEEAKCTNVLRDFAILSEEQEEHQVVYDIIDNFKDSDKKEKLEKSGDKIKLLRSIFNINYNYKELLSDYINLINNEIQLFPNNSLEGKYITFIGSGFPLSAILLNIFTGAKINLIDISSVAIDEAKSFLFLIDKMGIINKADFSLQIIDGKNLDLNQTKTDILYLAAALPKEIKKHILNRVYKTNTMVVDRYVDNLGTLMYYMPLLEKDLSKFKIVSILYANSILCKNSLNKKTKIICSTEHNINYARVLISK